MLKKLFAKKDKKIGQMARDLQKGNNMMRDNIGMSCEILEIVRSQQEAIENLNKNVKQLHKLIEEGKRL